ncbi:hypothetical protein Lal_00018744 [Lupinus albus]|nr:hypothetical protein Lal_00018744 [Lupinus albus]
MHKAVPHADTLTLTRLYCQMVRPKSSFCQNNSIGFSRGGVEHKEPSKIVLRMRHVHLFEEEPLLDEILKLVGFSKLSSLRCFNILKDEGQRHIRFIFHVVNVQLPWKMFQYN